MKVKMKYLKSFNEDVTDGNVIEPSSTMIDNDLVMSEENPLVDELENQDDQFTIFNDIESDIDNMDPSDAKDYLKSVIVFCNQKINDI